jgi:hypothetical protein
MAVKKKRTYNLSRIKQDFSYLIPEICECLGVCKGTVHQWLRKGLPKNDDAKPFLIHGSALRAFLAAQQSTRKQPCQPDQFYCFRCRQPRRPWGSVVDVHLHNEKVINLSGLCEQCECLINKRGAVKNLRQIAETFDIQTVHNSHIVETLPPSVRCYLERKTTT